MSTPKHRGGGNAVGNEDPTRLFNSPINDDELTLGLGELGESRTMAVAPEDNEALLNELLSAPISSPLGDGPLPGAKGTLQRGWAVSVTEAHPADREQSTVAIAQLDAPTIAFKAQQAKQTEQARSDYQKMLTTQPLTVQRNPGPPVPQGTAIMALPQMPPSSGPPVSAKTSVMPLPQYPASAPQQRAPQQAAPYSQQPVPPPSSSSHAVPQAPHSAPGQSGPQSGPMAAIPRIVPGAQKMPAVVIDKKKRGGFSGVLIAFVVLALLGGGGFYGYRTHRFTLPTGIVAAPAPVAPPQTTVAATGDTVAAPVVQASASAQPAAVAPPASDPAAAPASSAASASSAPAVVAAPAQPASAAVPAVAAVAAPPPVSDGHRRHRDTNSDPPASAPVAKTDEPKTEPKAAAPPKPAAEARPAKPGKGGKPADPAAAPPTTTAEEEEMKKATETLTNSL